MAWNPLEDSADAFHLAVALRLFRGFHDALQDALAAIGAENSPATMRLGILRAAAGFTPDELPAA